MRKDPFKEFLKAQIAKEKEVSTGSLFLDRAFGIPLGSFLLLKGPANFGTTAIVLGLAETLIELDKTVVYVDPILSAQPHKLSPRLAEKLLILRPWDLKPSEIYSVAIEILDIDSEAIFIFDNIYLLENLWKSSQWNFAELIRRIREYSFGSTIIGTQRESRHYDIWSQVVTIKGKENIYAKEEGASVHKGHILSLSGPRGKSEVYIDYSIGRVSKAYEEVFLQIEKGEKSLQSAFGTNDSRTTGAWNYIHKMGELSRRENETSKI